MRPPRVYHYRGQIEKPRGRSYAWRDGYSGGGSVGAIEYPWMTKSEARRAAKADGFTAVFYRDGKPEHDAKKGRTKGRRRRSRTGPARRHKMGGDHE